MSNATHKTEIEKLNTVAAGWSESFTGGMLVNSNPENGGIIDNEIVTGKWFVVFNDGRDSLTGYNTRAEAVDAFVFAITKGYYTPQVDDAIQPDEWPAFERLETGDPETGDWPGCQFRLQGRVSRYAVNVKTIRKPIKIDKNRFKSRCIIEFVNDGEENETARGYIYHN